MTNSAEQKIIAEIKKDAANSTALRCLNFGISTNKARPLDFFGSYKMLEENDKGDIVYRSRWICFDADGNRTACDPKFDDNTEYRNFYGQMFQLKTFKP